VDPTARSCTGLGGCSGGNGGVQDAGGGGQRICFDARGAARICIFLVVISWRCGQEEGCHKAQEIAQLVRHFDAFHVKNSANVRRFASPFSSCVAARGAAASDRLQRFKEAQEVESIGAH
jgi:hypothetical protein